VGDMELSSPNTSPIQRRGKRKVALVTLPSVAGTDRDAPPSGARLLNRDQAARWLGLAPHTLANWAVLGRGPRFARIGRSIRYDLRDLEEFLAQAKVQSTSEGVQ